jgi:L-fuculokinase
MPTTHVIAIFDVGKTNKKLFLLDEKYDIVWEQSQAFAETADEDGEACEDLEQLTDWVFAGAANLSKLADLDIRAVNFSAYGASFVHLGAEGIPVAPLYNYLKPFPPALRKNFYDRYGGEPSFSLQTASPVLGNLNSGMQLYRIKEQQPELFARIKVSLHLPQYLSWLHTGVAVSEITSIGCHTGLWDFPRQKYHGWVYREGLIDKLAPIVPSTHTLSLQQPVGTPFSPIQLAGVGLHDSSAALIPYLESFREPFVLLSTGTWCISMNPFNGTPLTAAELKEDCLCFISYQGKPVKASRLFAGHEHEQQVKRLAAHFQVAVSKAATIAFDPDIVSHLHSQEKTRPVGGAEAGSVLRDPDAGSFPPDPDGGTPLRASVFHLRDLGEFHHFEQAYHRLLMDIMERQIASIRRVLRGAEVNKIFVDGGFGKNPVYMHLLAAAFPHIGVFAASVPQASTLGAALAIHPHWNRQPLPDDLVCLTRYSPAFIHPDT